MDMADEGDPRKSERTWTKSWHHYTIFCANYVMFAYKEKGKTSIIRGWRLL